MCTYVCLCTYVVRVYCIHTCVLHTGELLDVGLLNHAHYTHSSAGGIPSGLSLHLWKPLFSGVFDANILVSPISSPHRVYSSHLYTYMMLHSIQLSHCPTLIMPVSKSQTTSKCWARDDTLQLYMLMLKFNCLLIYAIYITCLYNMSILSYLSGILYTIGHTRFKIIDHETILWWALNRHVLVEVEKPVFSGDSSCVPDHPLIWMWRVPCLFPASLKLSGLLNRLYRQKPVWWGI